MLPSLMQDQAGDHASGVRHELDLGVHDSEREQGGRLGEHLDLLLAGSLAEETGVLTADGEDKAGRE